MLDSLSGLKMHLLPNATKQNRNLTNCKFTDLWWWKICLLRAAYKILLVSWSWIRILTIIDCPHISKDWSCLPPSNPGVTGESSVGKGNSYSVPPEIHLTQTFYTDSYYATVYFADMFMYSGSFVRSLILKSAQMKHKFTAALENTN